MSSKKYYNETGQTVAAVTTDDQGHIFELQAMLPLALIELINQVKKHEVVTFITEYTSVPVDLLKAYGKEPLVFLAYMTERGLIVNVKRPHKEDAPAFRIEHHRDGVTRVVAMNTSARDFFRLSLRTWSTCSHSYCTRSPFTYNTSNRMALFYLQ